MRQHVIFLAPRITHAVSSGHKPWNIATHHKYYVALYHSSDETQKRLHSQLSVNHFESCLQLMSCLVLPLKNLDDCSLPFVVSHIFSARFERVTSFRYMFSAYCFVTINFHDLTVNYSCGHDIYL